MLITMSADGSLITSVPSVINQGSNNANQLVVVSPIAESNSLTITFKLPNGNYTEPALMTPAENIDTQLGFNAWTYLLNYNITQYSGRVEYQIKATNVSGDAITSSAGTFNVVAGVPPTLPQTPTQDIYNQILQSLSNISQQYINVTDNLSTGAYPANSIIEYNNSITYLENSLVHENGILYVSKQGTRGNSPESDTSNTYWDMFLNIKTLNLGSSFSQATPVISDNGITFYLTTNINGTNLSTNSLLGLPIIAGNNIDFTINENNSIVLSSPTAKITAGDNIVIEGDVISVNEDIPNSIENLSNNTTVIANSNGGFSAGANNNYSGGGIVIGQNNTNNSDEGIVIGKNNTSFSGVTIGRGSSTTHAYGISIGDKASTQSGVSIGSNSQSTGGVAIGDNSNARNGNAIGDSAMSGDHGGAIGDGAISGRGFAGGYNARTGSTTQVTDAIQLGTGLNEDYQTFQVYSYKLMNADGTIPSERLNLMAGNGINITGSTISANTSYLATQDFVTSAISNISQFSIVKVDSLPAQGESNKLYLVPNSSSTTDNVYDEYIWVEVSSGTFDWEQIGTTAIDLSNYVTTDTTQTITGAKTFTQPITIQYRKYLDVLNIGDYRNRIDNVGLRFITGSSISHTIGRDIENSYTNLIYKNYLTNVEYNFDDVALKTDIPDTSTFAKLNNEQTFTQTQYFAGIGDNLGFDTLKVASGGGQEQIGMGYRGLRFYGVNISHNTGSIGNSRGNNGDNLYYTDLRNNGTAQFVFSDLPIKVTGDTLVEYLSTSSSKGKIYSGQVVICTENDTNNTYTAGHLYLIGGSSGAYTATDITPAGGSGGTSTTYETLTVASTSWIMLNNSSPYTYQATVTLTTTLSDDSVVELINNQAVLFATYGFAIASISGQVATIYSIGQPTENVNLTMGVTA